MILLRISGKRIRIPPLRKHGTFAGGRMRKLRLLSGAMDTPPKRQCANCVETTNTSPACNRQGICLAELEINTFPPEFQQCVENWVEKFSRKFQQFGENPTRIPLFHENCIPQAVKRNSGRRDFPQNFQEIFPFHSTISAHFHGKK